MTDTEVRIARDDEESTVRSICNAAMLEVPEAAVREGTVLVAVEGDRILGALVLDGEEIEAVAVRPGRRGQGIGAALVEAAAERRGELTAGFDSGVRPFYEALGFEVECEDGRCRGVLR
ncbi:GNAT family N-acetyltransferase [Natronomonas halophila]|uniref:GNAT family N-acetyltransferase n=1 Tax=Natronomonas halophila TaxID=2747817 RepID=UPI0015B3AB4C|nr:GNAT family N-acetyltransferase [Natronomonas halophila]QLD86240.1 GNAT family N-acetyltransferase [Natronomonas halophila]